MNTKQRPLNGGQTHWASTNPSYFAMHCTVILLGLVLNMTLTLGSRHRSRATNQQSARLPIGDPLKTGRIGPMQHGEIWFAQTPGGDRPVLVLTRDPVAGRIGSVVVAAITRTIRGLVSELELTPDDGVPTDCAVNFDNIHTIPRDAFRRRITALEPPRLAQACRTLRDATGC